MQKLLKGNLKAIDFANDNRTVAESLVATGIFNATGQRVDKATITNSWEHLTFTADPLAVDPGEVGQGRRGAWACSSR